MNLLDAPTGVDLVVKRCVGGAGATTRLLEMGIVPGATIQRTGRMAGPACVRILESTVAIGRGLASMVEVEKV
jgi:Fe2+ transport system protein FeoA